MAFADKSVTYDEGDGSILGGFNEKQFGKYFEFSKNNETAGYGAEVKKDFPHKVWVTSKTMKGLDSGFRYANVKKTVAYVLVDEDDEGNPIVDKWQIKNFRLYRP